MAASQVSAEVTRGDEMYYYQRSSYHALSSGGGDGGSDGGVSTQMDPSGVCPPGASAAAASPGGLLLISSSPATSADLQTASLNPICLLANGSNYIYNMGGPKLEMVTAGVDVGAAVGTVALEVPGASVLPREMTFNENSLISVVSYSVLLVVGGLGNLIVFVTLFRNRHRRSRVNRFIMHLSVADMIVTFIMMPLEIGWHLTVSWRAGDTTCRALMFFRALGFYLSSFILISISLDRYFAIAHPLSLTDANHRGSLMLVLAWIFSIIASIPQSIIFHVEYHPLYKDYAQCVTFHFFPTPTHELAYNLFNIVAVYALPLVVIIVSYTLILMEISRKSRQSKAAASLSSESSSVYMRRVETTRVSSTPIEKARIRTLKMTIVIVVVFIVCWTPYFVMSAWWWFDKDTAEKIDNKVQRGLFLFAVSNSCVDPIVYGMFTTVFRRAMRKHWAIFKSWFYTPASFSHYTDWRQVHQHAGPYG